MQKIILLHGALGSSADMKPLAEKLSQREFVPHVFSFSGHGEKSFEKEFGIEQFTLELENYIKDKQLEGALVFGYSMGGYVALKLATQKASLLPAVITLGTKFHWTREAVEKEAKNCDVEFLKEKAPAFVTKLQNKHAMCDQLLQRSRTMIENFATNNFLSSEHLKRISSAVLLGLGDNDKMVTLDETVAVRESIPNASMYMLPLTKHPFEQVNLELLAAIIENFQKKPGSKLT